jgi:hypothetical protein
MPTIDEIIGSAKLPEQTVRLCMRGDLVAEHQALDARIKDMGTWEPSSLADSDPRAALAEQIADLESEIADAERDFTFRALGRRKYRELLDAHPGEPGTRFNAESFIPALIAACCISPEMTRTDADRLFDVLNEGAVEVLFMAAYTVNEGLTKVPFSATASALTRKRETS